MNFHPATQIKTLLSDYDGLWMVAGGWAIDLFINRVTRHHHDIEIAIPRKDQLKLQVYLQSWELRYVVEGTFFDWKDGQYLELPIHEIHGKNLQGDTLEILMNEIEGDTFRFRRNLDIQLPLDKTVLQSPTGIPILCPEVVLLYKAKWAEEKDEHDLMQILPFLSREQKLWLKEAIFIQHESHPWLRDL